MRVADTSFIMTLFDSTDPRQGEARSKVADTEPIIVPAEVLTETLGVVHARRGFAAANALWVDLGKIPHLEFLETAEGEETAHFFDGARGALTWVDAAVVARCIAEGAEPLCFDDDIVKAVRSRRKVR